MQYKLSILGCGNMCGSILQGALNKHLFKPQEIVIKNSSFTRSQTVANHFQVHATDTITDIETAELVMLGIKPQMLNDIALHVSNSSTVISVLAGITTKTLSQKLNTPNVVRVMPNMAAKVNQGLSGVFFSPTIDSHTQQQIIAVLETSGEVIILPQEDYMNRFMVLSGSLIGILGFWEHNFAYYNQENVQAELIKILHHLSSEKFFQAPDGQKIINQTFTGYQAMREKTGITAQEMQQRVSSKGGVTEAMTNFLNTEAAQSVQQKFFKHPTKNSQSMTDIIRKMFTVGEEKSEMLSFHCEN
ncbi:hypothetical protein CSB37_03945 [bacterium DOLZORAL124_38_8]|nr:MAG: hypothetical protein CSB37_03945 [bacterium DOLZORAL124_38_8]